MVGDSLDTAVGGSWSVGHHLALAGDVVVAGERGVVGHQPVLGGDVLRGVGTVWLGVITLQHGQWLNCRDVKSALHICLFDVLL